MLKKLLLASTFLTFLTTPFFSQNDKDYSAQFLRDFVSKSWSTQDGLPGNTITDINQNSEGFILLGTYEGLVRFDGIVFETLNRSKDPKLPFVSARRVFEDSRGNLWIGSNDEGVTVMKKDGSLQYYDTSLGLPNNSIRAFCEDKSGNVWIGTSSGLAQVSKNFAISIPSGIELLPNKNKYLINHLFCDTMGRVWFTSTESVGVFYYDNWQFTHFTGLKDGDNNRISYVTQDSSGAFWFGLTKRAAIKVTGEKQEYYNINFNEDKGLGINHIMEDRDHNMWIAMDNGIAIITHEGKLVFFDQIHGLVDERIIKVVQDREDNIWIATDRGGIQKLTKAKFRTNSLLRTVNSIAQDKMRGVVWIGCDNGLLCIKDDEPVENEITRKFRNIRIRHVDIDKDDALLVSCYEVMGQVKITASGEFLQWTNKNGLAGRKVRVAFTASNGDLYVGTTTGLSIIDAQTGEITNIRKEFGIENDYIMCISEAKDGSIWVGTDGGGIFVLKNRQLEKVFNTSNGLVGNIIFKISRYSDQIWVCTGSGISIFDSNGVIHNLNSFNGLGTDSVFQAIYDGNKNVWGTSNRGIFAFRMQDVQDYIDGKDKTVSSKFYNKSDGIDSGGVTSTSKSMLMSNGEIWFTLIDGYCVLNTNLTDAQSVKPLVCVKNVMIDFESHDYPRGKIIVPADTKRLSISYSGLSFCAPDKVLYRTRLIGFDKAFSPWTDRREVSYTNLKPGSYEFYIIAQNSDDVQSDMSSPLKLVVKPTLFQRWYFWFILIVLLVLSLAIGIRRRITYMQKMQDILEELVNERTKELSALQKSLEHQVLDRTKELDGAKKKVQILSKEITNALVSTIDAKDTYTNGHSKRVAKYSGMIAEKLGKTEDEIETISYAGLLHDIGKIGIPDTIINKKDKLDDSEWEIVKSHPLKGAEILDTIKSMPEIKQGARWHHERYDGKGYPDHIAGKQIPEIARIIGVADSYDAMTSNRSYRKYMAQDKVREQIEQGKGTQFDPLIADKMLEIIDEDKDYKLHE